MEDVIAVYEALRPLMPSPMISDPDSTITHPKSVRQLVEILPEVDALFLDGFGVINVGQDPVDGIHEFLAEAEAQNVALMVLTNGASHGAENTWAKYQKWGLPFVREQVVSSRDALTAELDNISSEVIIGSIDRVVTPLDRAGGVALANGDDVFNEAGLFAFLGATGWGEDDQAALEAAIGKGNQPLYIANPDVGAPFDGGFTNEPGYWAARTIKATGVTTSWFGKPHRAIFDLTFARLEAFYNRKFERNRVAMVGDSLHTDILGASAAGLRSVLLTGYGLFRDGGAGEMIELCKIYPDWIAATL